MLDYPGQREEANRRRKSSYSGSPTPKEPWLIARPFHSTARCTKNNERSNSALLTTRLVASRGTASDGQIIRGIRAPICRRSHLVKSAAHFTAVSTSYLGLGTRHRIYTGPKSLCRTRPGDGTFAASSGALIGVTASESRTGASKPAIHSICAVLFCPSLTSHDS